MTTTSTSTTNRLALPEIVFTGSERIALAGFLAGYRGLTRDAYALDLHQFVAWCDRHELKLFSGPPGRYRALRPGAGEAGRARPHLASRPKRPPSLGSHRRRHRSARPRARPPHAHRAAQGRQGRDRPAGPSNSEGGRPRDRGARERADLHKRQRQALRPPRGWPGRPAGGPAGRYQQSNWAAHPPPCVHNRQFRCRCTAPRCPRGSEPRRPRTTMRYDRARVSLDRHATYIVATYIAGASR